VNLAALAICGAALVSGLLAAAADPRLPVSSRPSGPRRVTRALATRESLHFVAAFTIVAALPLLAVAAPAGDTIRPVDGAIAIVGAVAAVFGVWLLQWREGAGGPDGEGGAASGIAAIGLLAVAAAALAAVVAGATVGLPAGRSDAAHSAALAAGFGLAVISIPMVFGAEPRGRAVGIAIAIVAGGLIDRAVGPWTPAVALLAPALVAVVASVTRPSVVVRLARLGAAAADVEWPTPRRAVERAGEAFDRRVLGLAVVGAPLVVGLGALALLAAGPRVGIETTPAAARASTLLVVVGGFGIALLALVEGARGAPGDPSRLLPAAAAVPVAALALRLADPIAGLLLATVATLVAIAGTTSDGRRPRDAARGPRGRRAAPRTIAWGATSPGSVTAASALLGGAGLLLATSRFDALAEGPALGTLVIGAAVALRVGAIPFHRLVLAGADEAPGSALGLVLGWLPAVSALIVLGGAAGIPLVPGAAGLGSPAPPLDGIERLVILAVGLGTIVLAALASAAQSSLRHAVAYLVVSQAGWLVLAATAPATAAPPVIGWLVPFAASALLLGGCVARLTPAPDARSVPDLAGFGRSQPIVLIALVVAAVAAVGLPGTEPWAARLAIGDAAFGSRPVALVVCLFGAAAVALAAGRLVAVGLRPRGAGVTTPGSPRLGRLPRVGRTTLPALPADPDDWLAGLALATMTLGTLAVVFGSIG
jgi:Proton-conducting membrane transporter